SRCGSSLQRNDAGVWLCEYPGLSFQRSPVCACSLVSSLLLSGATMSQQSSLTQSAHSVRQVLTAYIRTDGSLPIRCRLKADVGASSIARGTSVRCALSRGKGAMASRGLPFQALANA